jgi:hypothetical protein
VFEEHQHPWLKLELWKRMCNCLITIACSRTRSLATLAPWPLMRSVMCLFPNDAFWNN